MSTDTTELKGRVVQLEDTAQEAHAHLRERLAAQQAELEELRDEVRRLQERVADCDHPNG